ncbi:MAG TPA: D-alanyl-D-alanine carboxypeptidase, partial [Actinopolymorphaceae bacterium]
MLVFALVFGAVAPSVPARATPITVTVADLPGRDEPDKASAEKKRAPKAYPPPPAAAEAYMVVDLNTGDVLAARHPHKRMRPASTQKMLTALVLLPKLDRKAYYRASKADTEFQGTALGLHPGF